MNTDDVRFLEDTHSYVCGGRFLSGVTAVCSWLLPLKYAAIKPSILMAAAERGTMIHKEIAEAVAGSGLLIYSDETLAASRLLDEYGLTPVAAERLVWDKKKDFASFVDLVCDDTDGKKVLLDIKCTSKIHTVSCGVQLSFYAYMYENVTGGRIDSVGVLWLPRKCYGEPRIEFVDILPYEIVLDLSEAYLRGDGNTLMLGKVLDFYGSDLLQ